MSGRPGRPCGECGSDSLHTHLPPTPAPAEDRDGRLRDLAAQIRDDAYLDGGRLLIALLSAFADEVRGQAGELCRDPEHTFANRDCLLDEKRELQADLRAAEAGKREAEERVKKLESALAKTTAEIIADGNRADLKLARDVAEAEVARLREERDSLSNAAWAQGCKLNAAQRQVEELTRERDDAHALLKRLGRHPRLLVRLAVDSAVADLAALQGTAPRPSGFCSAHRDGEDPSCRICYQGTEPKPEPKA